MADPRTCPGCGALTTPQLVHCRRCERYLHGTRLEGLLFGSLPGPLARAPGTGLMVVLIVAVWLAMLGATRFDGVLSFSGYSLRQLGAMQAPFLLDGEWWRLATSMLGHHDLLHLLFNLWALIVAGSVTERLFGRHKAWAVFVVAGIGSMACSFGWNTFVVAGPRIITTSIGASGAVSGLIGAALIGAWRGGYPQLVRALGRWVFYLVIWGVLVPNIDNAAHGGGFVVGAGLALLLRPGLSESQRARTAWSAATLASFLGLLAAETVVFVEASAYPTTLERDAERRSFLGFTISEATAWEASSQRDALGACARAVERHEPIEVIEDRCEFARRASPAHHGVWRVLSEVAAAQGDGAASRRYEAIADRLESALEPAR